MRRFKTYSLISLIVLSLSVSAGRIKKGFEALEIYNYFKAKNLFEKTLKRHEAASSYGLSVIYQRTDNPFTNIDSAYNFVQRSFNAYNILDLKKKEKYRAFGVDSLSILNQRCLISEDLYRRARSKHTIAGYDLFIQKNDWSDFLDSAIFLRDELAYTNADIQGTSDAYNNFLSLYPNSDFGKSANSKYQNTLYTELTASNSFTSYVEFIENHPKSPYRTDAEDKIFEIYTETGSILSYKNFIYEFPENHNVNKAWKHMYNAHLAGEYTPDRIIEFSAQFPDYPYLDELNEELELINTRFYPIKDQDTWGFVDEDGDVRVKTVYQGVEWFKEGLSVVRINEKYGYINKRGQLEIAAIFDDALDFSEGHAVVEVNEKWGMINRNGEYIVQPEYQDLGNLMDGFAYFQADNDLYGYFDSKGVVRLKPVYDMAYDFQSGEAIVSTNGYYGLIDEFGTTKIPMKYEDLVEFDEYSFKAKLDGHWGLITLKSDTLLPFEFDYIGNYYDNRAIVEVGFRFNYVDLDGNYLMTEWLDTYAESKQLAVFQNGYAKIKFDKGYNLIDTNGIKVFNQEKEGIGAYGNLISAQKEGDWGYVNEKGKMMIDYQYSNALSFENGTALVEMSPLWGVINENGESIVEPIYESLSYINDTLLLAKRMGTYGLISTKGDTILNFYYVSIEPIDEQVVEVEEGGRVYFFNLISSEFIRKED